MGKMLFCPSPKQSKCPSLDLKSRKEEYTYIQKDQIDVDDKGVPVTAKKGDSNPKSTEASEVP
jgi:hypothetical protein